MAVIAIHQRMAELWTIRKRRELTNAELDEMALCLDANANYVWKMVRLENLSLMASMTNDYDWLHEICRRIDELEGETKKPGHKGTD
ncbi:DUF7667 family protein [Paenibacillus glucanolyticus]|uniref:DUF7667 family protein n=1 Tax=Paenibacillus glucanolyticus TaxID=59843 RepID=UPI003D01748B